MPTSASTLGYRLCLNVDRWKGSAHGVRGLPFCLPHARALRMPLPTCFLRLVPFGSPFQIASLARPSSSPSSHGEARPELPIRRIFVQRWTVLRRMGSRSGLADGRRCTCGSGPEAAVCIMPGQSHGGEGKENGARPASLKTCVYGAFGRQRTSHSTHICPAVDSFASNGK